MTATRVRPRLRVLEIGWTHRMKIRFTITKVERRTRVISTTQDNSVSEQFWCIVLQPGHIALDFGNEEPKAKVGDKLLLVREP